MVHLGWNLLGVAVAGYVACTNQASDQLTQHAGLKGVRWHFKMVAAGNSNWPLNITTHIRLVLVLVSGQWMGSLASLVIAADSGQRGAG